MADVLRNLKKASSVWIHKEIGLRDFAWQEGDSAFTVSPTARDSVKRYLARQAEHHRKQDSRTELIELLRHAGVEYEPCYFD